MNTILQQRIDDAASTTVQNLYDCAKQARNHEASEYDEGYLDAIDVQGDFLFREGANYAISHQWIPVEEALPEEDVPNCFVAYKAMDAVLYSTGGYEKGNKEWYVDGVGFDAEVTHWMPIPTLEGGKG